MCLTTWASNRHARKKNTKNQSLTALGIAGLLFCKKHRHDMAAHRQERINLPFGNTILDPYAKLDTVKITDCQSYSKTTLAFEAASASFLQCLSGKLRASCRVIATHLPSMEILLGIGFHRKVLFPGDLFLQLVTYFPVRIIYSGINVSRGNFLQTQILAE